MFSSPTLISTFSCYKVCFTWSISWCILKYNSSQGWNRIQQINIKQTCRRLLGNIRNTWSEYFALKMSSPLNTNDSNSRRDNEETNDDDITEENEAQVDLLVSIMSKFIQRHICAENFTKHDAPYEPTIINKTRDTCSTNYIAY